jgi:hypothetical protein
VSLATESVADLDFVPTTDDDEEDSPTSESEQPTPDERNDVMHAAYHPKVARFLEKVKVENKLVTRRLRYLATQWCIIIRVPKKYVVPATKRRIFKPKNIYATLQQRPNYLPEDLALVGALANAKNYAFKGDSKQENIMEQLIGEAFDVLVKIKEDLETDPALNEWALINATLCPLINKYITLCCRGLFRVYYDKIEDKIRPDLKFVLKGSHAIKFLVVEVAREELNTLGHFATSHKDAKKLPTVMRGLLDEQLKILAPKDAGVFGILMGKLHAALRM